MLTILNIAVVQKTEIICETYVIDTDGTSSNFAQKSITEQ